MNIVVTTFHLAKAIDCYLVCFSRSYDIKIITLYFVRGVRSVNRILIASIEIIKELLFLGAVPELSNSSY